MMPVAQKLSLPIFGRDPRRRVAIALLPDRAPATAWLVQQPDRDRRTSPRGSRTDSDDLSELSEGALGELGPVLAAVQRALEQELHAQRVYIGRYGHSPGYPIHFHVIPIYDWVEALFWKDERYRLLGNFAEGPGETVTDGAELTLFVWREFCERAEPPTIKGPTVSEVVGLLREVVCLSSRTLPDQEMMRCDRKRR